jgi:hypothetical protein
MTPKCQVARKYYIDSLLLLQHVSISEEDILLFYGFCCPLPVRLLGFGAML